MQHFFSKGVFILDLCSRRILQSTYGKQSGRNYYFTLNCNCLFETRHNKRIFVITDLLLCSVLQRFFIPAVNILAYINTTSNINVYLQLKLSVIHNGMLCHQRMFQVVRWHQYLWDCYVIKIALPDKTFMKPTILTGNYSYFDPQNDANRAFSVRLCITLFCRYLFYNFIEIPRCWSGRPRLINQLISIINK